MPSPPKPTPADEASIRAFKASEPQPPGFPTRSDVVRGGVEVQQPVSPNKNAAGINVSTSSEVSSGVQARVAPPPSAVSSGVAVASTAATGRNLSPVTSNLSPVLPKLDPRLKGILDDPYNYYRQYPEDPSGKLRYLIENRHQWPQPADDKLPPNAVYSMSDGARIPFTIVNREPKTFNYDGDFKSERWPVMLNIEEKLQVATARFYELLAAARTAMEQQQKEAASNRDQVFSAAS